MNGHTLIDVPDGESHHIIIRHPGGRRLLIVAEVPAKRTPGTLRLDMQQPQHVDNREPGGMTMFWAMPPSALGPGGQQPSPAGRPGVADRLLESQRRNTELLVALFDVRAAGLEMAECMEDVIQGCGNAPPHPDDCDDCRPEREALDSWARVNGRVSMMLERQGDAVEVRAAARNGHSGGLVTRETAGDKEVILRADEAVMQPKRDQNSDLTRAQVENIIEGLASLPGTRVVVPMQGDPGLSCGMILHDKIAGVGPQQLPASPDWHMEAVEAADEIAAWVSPPPLDAESVAMVGAWFGRLRRCMTEIGIEQGDQAANELLLRADLIIAGLLAGRRSADVASWIGATRERVSSACDRLEDCGSCGNCGAEPAQMDAHSVGGDDPECCPTCGSLRCEHCARANCICSTGWER